MNDFKRIEPTRNVRIYHGFTQSEWKRKGGWDLNKGLEPWIFQGRVCRLDNYETNLDPTKHHIQPTISLCLRWHAPFINIICDSLGTLTLNDKPLLYPDWRINHSLVDNAFEYAYKNPYYPENISDPSENTSGWAL